MSVKPSTTKEGKTLEMLWEQARNAENGSAEFHVATIQAEIMHRLDTARELFVQNARWIADNLNTIAATIESDATRRPNSLGELQSSASELNALCGKIDALRTMLVGPMG